MLKNFMNCLQFVKEMVLHKSFYQHVYALKYKELIQIQMIQFQTSSTNSFNITFKLMYHSINRLTEQFELL